MSEEEIAKRFCKFELCRHRNGEGMCCLYNQDNCIFHKLEKENAELKEQIEKQVMIKIDNTPNLYTKQLEEKLCDSQNTTQFWRELAEQRSRANTSIVEEYNVCIGGLQDQLTKATEIIKTLASDLSMYSGNYQKELLEAEQFIKEIEK